MRILSFLVLSFLVFWSLALPVFAGNVIDDICCPTCPDWEKWGLSELNTVIYQPEELPENLLDCVMMQPRFVR